MHNLSSWSNRLGALVLPGQKYVVSCIIPAQKIHQFEDALGRPDNGGGVSNLKINCLDFDGYEIVQLSFSNSLSLSLSLSQLHALSPTQTTDNLSHKRTPRINLFLILRNLKLKMR